MQDIDKGATFLSTERKKNYQYRFQYPAKILFKYESEIRFPQTKTERSHWYQTCITGNAKKISSGQKNMSDGKEKHEKMFNMVGNYSKAK